MKKIIQKLKNNFISMIEQDDKLAILSLSIIFIAFFICLVGVLTPSKDLQSQRYVISVFMFYVGFYMIPIATNKQKDKLILSSVFVLVDVLLGTFTLYYWAVSINWTNANILADIIMSISLIYVIYRFIYRVYWLIMTFVSFISKLTAKLFPESTHHRGIKYFVERLTALLVTLGGVLATALTVITTIKAIFDTFT